LERSASYPESRTAELTSAKEGVEVALEREMHVMPGVSRSVVTYAGPRPICRQLVLTEEEEEEEVVVQEVVEEELLGNLTLCNMLAMVEEEDMAIMEAESTNTSISTMH